MLECKKLEEMEVPCQDEFDSPIIYPRDYLPTVKPIIKCLFIHKKYVPL